MSLPPAHLQRDPPGVNSIRCLHGSPQLLHRLLHRNLHRDLGLCCPTASQAVRSHPAAQPGCCHCTCTCSRTHLTALLVAAATGGQRRPRRPGRHPGGRGRRCGFNSQDFNVVYEKMLQQHKVEMSPLLSARGLKGMSAFSVPIAGSTMAVDVPRIYGQTWLVLHAAEDVPELVENFEATADK